MFPHFANTAASLTRATALMSRVGTDAYLYDEPEDGNIAVLLDSKFEAEKVEGMKRLIALLSQGRDVSSFFPHVVKNVATSSLEVKKLVYIYLVHYAEKRPDEALLSINSFQKDLSDLNPLVRAWSLRAMSGIRVRVVVPLVVMAVTKCSRDPSAYVRRCAAHAIPKIFSVDHDSHQDVLEELVGVLLSDSSAGVVGAAASAFLAVCPDQLSLLGPRFRKLCEKLPDVDEWGQVVLLDILMRYAVARYDALRDSIYFLSSAKKGDQPSKVQERLTGENSELSEEDIVEDSKIPADIQGLLHFSTPLFQSQNSAVVLAVAGIYWVFAPRKDVKSIVKPLLFLLRSSYDSQYVVLANIASFASAMPSLFENHYMEFFIRSMDTDPIRALKLDILTTIATEASIHAILQEFQVHISSRYKLPEAYVRDTNRQFAANTVSAIGRCAVRLPAVAAACVEGLLMLAKGALLSCDGKEVDEEGEQETLPTQGQPNVPSKQKGSQEAGVVAQAVLALRSIVQQNPSEQEQVFACLVRLLDHMTVPEARAVVIWMVGEHSLGSTRVSQMLPIVLCYLAGSFIKEADETKLQILNCAAKVTLRLEEAPDSPLKKTAALVLEHTLNLGRQDLSNDIRDRARLLQQLVLSQATASLLGNHKEESSSDMTERLQSLGLHGSATDLATQTISENNGALSPELTKVNKEDVFRKLAKQILLVPKSPPVLPALAPDRSSFLPGTMSHIVNHHAPGYMPLPEPHSLEKRTDENGPTSDRDPRFSREQGRPSSDYSDSGSDEASTESRGGTSDSFSDEERGVYDGSEGSLSNEDQRTTTAQKPLMVSSQLQGRGDMSFAPLISLDEEFAGRGNGSHEYNIPMKSTMDLDSWLDSPSIETQNTAQAGGTSSSQSYASLSLGPLNPVMTRLTLLDFTNGNGLDVKYTFVRTSPENLESMVCIRLYFYNRSQEPMMGIIVRAAECPAPGDNGELPQTSSDSRTVVPNEEISELGPGSTVEGDLYVDFQHQLTAVKLAVVINGSSYPVKLSPEVGFLLRPLQLTTKAFSSAELQISGMHESSRSCNLGGAYSNPVSKSGEDKVLAMSRAIATGVLRSAHVAIVSVILPISDVSGLTGLRLCFAGKTLTQPLPCLISVTFTTDHEGASRDIVPVLIKVNCEDTIFGLNLLKQLETTLSS